MEIREAKVESWLQNNTEDHIARCARVCYASDKTTANDKMCNALWKNKHRSMFRHAGVYYIIPERLQLDKRAYIGAVVRLHNNEYFVSTHEHIAH